MQNHSIENTLLMADVLAQDLQEEISRLKNENAELAHGLKKAQARIEDLEQKLASVPRGGRPNKYNAKFRAAVRKYYRTGHTYRETASHFRISTNTVSRFLCEQ